MESLTYFLIEMTISISVGLIVLAILSNPLRKLLIDLCGTEERANFWMTYSNIMLILAPLLTNIMFGISGTVRVQDFYFYKLSFGCALFGVFGALLFLGHQISKTIPVKEQY